MRKNITVFLFVLGMFVLILTLQHLMRQKIEKKGTPTGSTYAMIVTQPTLIAKQFSCKADNVPAMAGAKQYAKKSRAQEVDAKCRSDTA